MAFLESRLDPVITRGALRKVTQPGRRKTYVSGMLEQDFNNTMPVHKYELSHGLRLAMTVGGLTPERSYFKVMDAFYVVMFTPYEGLRMKDWADFQGVKDNTALQLISAARSRFSPSVSPLTLLHLSSCSYCRCSRPR